MGVKTYVNLKYIKSNYFQEHSGGLAYSFNADKGTEPTCLIFLDLITFLIFVE
jgi:hypothetical protein